MAIYQAQILQEGDQHILLCCAWALLICNRRSLVGLKADGPRQWLIGAAGTLASENLIVNDPEIDIDDADSTHLRPLRQATRGIETVWREEVTV